MKCTRVSNRTRRVRLSDVKTRRYIFRNGTPARVSPHFAYARVTVLIIANAFFRRSGSVLTVNQRPIRLPDNRIVLSDGTIFFTELSPVRFHRDSSYTISLQIRPLMHKWTILILIIELRTFTGDRVLSTKKCNMLNVRYVLCIELLRGWEIVCCIK